jgi:Skp family chaperone for outer membrane proteins
MKKIIILLCISLFCAHSFTAQGKKEGKEKIRTLKIAYITEQLELTTSEAEKFWPIYNMYDKEQHTLRGSYRFTLKKAIQKNETLDSLSEDESRKLIVLKLNTDKKLYEAQKDFVKKIEGVISYKKIIKLQMAEIEFGRNLMRKYKRKRSDSKN